MVSERERYAPGADGAPPVPPAGGYRGRRRAFSPAVLQQAQVPIAQPAPPSEPASAAEAIARISTPAPNTKQAGIPVTASVNETIHNAHRAFGTVALAVSVVFACALLFMLFAARPETYWATPMLLIQVVVIGVELYAVTKPPARFRALMALAVTAIFNVATVSMLAMVLVG